MSRSFSYATMGVHVGLTPKLTVPFAEVAGHLSLGLPPCGPLHHAVAVKREEARNHYTNERPDRRPVEACALPSSGEGSA